MQAANAVPIVNGERLWSRLMQMAEIGATAHGGCNRQALTELDFVGRKLLRRWGEALGCSARVDAVGNLFLRRAGGDERLPVVLTGSHLDTQPTGGKFDGVYGVLAGLEVIEALNERSIRTAHPIELAVWCNEEGSRFPAAMMGSAVWAGSMPLESAYALTDASGISVREALQRGGVQLDQQAPRQAVKAAFEVHIEQGPVLERQAKTIGIVTGVQNMCRYEVAVQGQEAHAGPTPMSARRDPIRVLAQVLPELYRIAERHGSDARVTVGIIETFPGSPNTVPGRLRFTVDLRHPDAGRYRALREDLQRCVEQALERQQLTGSVRCYWEAPGVVFDSSCIAAVRRAAGALGYDSMEIVSGAGHDSCNIAAVAPTAMIFVPCAGGLSHNEAERATQADLQAGANVLLNAILAVATESQ
jgi:beta-ureidopropionase / N-carbamoyl-L-amino-acid hydrolase